MKMEVKLTGLEGTLLALKVLPQEIASKRGGPVRVALRKAAAVIHKQARANLQAVTQNATDPEKRESTGLLIKNLVVTRGKEPTGTKGERYLVRVRRKSYQREGAVVTTLKTAQLLEHGSSHQPAEPWLRPAFGSTAEKAIKVAETEISRAVALAVQKLAKQNGGR